MQNTSITIPFDQEKLRALQFYMGRKDGNLEKELTTHVQRLYEKYVPTSTREYIEMLSGGGSD